MDPDEHRRHRALAWLMSLRDAGTDQRAAFEAWRTDPANRAAFADVEALWLAAGPAAQRLAERDAASLRPLLAASRTAHARRSLILAGAAGIGAIAASALWLERPSLLVDAFADLATSRGERRSMGLPDGSSLELEADSALDLGFTAFERRVRLKRGAAWFAVMPGPTPFVVAVAGAEVRVLGTEFGLRLVGDEAELSVAHGRVELLIAGGAPAMLGRGEQVRFGAGGAGPVLAITPEQAAPWRDGRLIFQQAKLREVIEAIARHRPGRIVVASAALAERRVSVNLPAADTDGALASLQSILGFRRQDLTAHLIILR